jgi:glucose/arabinose dehydrogenase
MRLSTISIIFTLAFLTLFFFSDNKSWAINYKTIELEDMQLNLPSDVQITIFANDTPKARHMAFDDQGTLFLSQARAGKITALPDLDHDGRADKNITILKNRDAPHGLAFVQLPSGYFLYIAEEEQVVRMKRIAKPFRYGPPETIISDIPGGGHFTRTIKIKGDKLYLSIGSSCNACIEKNNIRAAISTYDLDGKNGKIFASGLRNSVGIEFSPYSGELWGVNNGRDWQGNEFPREELNIIHQGKHYGWPFCNENRIPDPDFAGHIDCSNTEPPAYMFPAHWAPLGLAFYRKGSLDSNYDHSVFIAFHGSWNRTNPEGYKVVRVILNDKGEILGHQDFIIGWLLPNGDKDGRPVDLEQSPEGDLYLSDDYRRGVVYLITTHQ